MEQTRYLVLEDSTVFEGKAFGSNHFEIGQIVSNTTMTGYQEIIADNTNAGKLLALTYPMIGSYGLTREIIENANPYLFGLIVGEKTNEPSNWKSELTLDEFLKLKNIPGIEGIDTRMLTKHIRQQGEMKAVLTDSLENIEALIETLKSYDLPNNWVEKLSIVNSFRIPNKGDKILVIDLGSTEAIIKELNYRTIDITVVPYNMSAEEILSIKPNGLIISNGPGNVESLSSMLPTIKSLIGQLPILGIGLGHQLIALAQGAKVKVLVNSQRGGNYPVKSLVSGRLENLVKNHQSVVDEESLAVSDLTITHRDVNTQVIDGLMNEAKWLNSVQYQPQTSQLNQFDEAYRLFYRHIELFKESKGDYHA